MSLQRALPWLVLALVASVVFMIACAGRDLSTLTGSASAAFAALIVIVGLGINKPLWGLDAARITDTAAPIAALRNARLMALTYAWGAAAMTGVYTLGGLRWQHGWQYGAGMALLALFSWGFGAAIGNAQNPATKRMLLLRGLQLTIVQGVAAAAGVLYLLTSGKLMTLRSDWAANQIFIAGGVAIAILSAMAIRTQWKLTCR